MSQFKTYNPLSRQWSDRAKSLTAPPLHILTIFLNKSLCPVVNTKAQLEWFGLASKDTEPLRNSTHVLDLRVWEEHRILQRRHEGELLTAPNVLSRRSIFSMQEIDRAFTSVWLAPCCDCIYEVQSECCNNWMG